MPSIPPLPPFPTLNELEDYFRDVTAYVPHIPHDLASAVRNVYDDLMRFGPPELPESLSMAEVGKLFVVSVPAAVAKPPPPPPPKTAAERAISWLKDHRLASSLAAVTVLGTIGYGAYHYKATHDRIETLRKRVASKRKARQAAGEPEREIVVILGADSIPYGPSVVRSFQKNGYIVLASVFSGEAADDLERDTEGYVRALVLDAEEPAAIAHFLRSLSSTLSLRFPTTIHGDPYQSMSASTSSTNSSGSLSRVASVISFLSLGPADVLPLSSFSSPITFSESYIHEYTTRALSPLSILTALLPLFRVRKTLGSPSSPSSSTWIGGRGQGASMILCVPASARVGAVGSSGNAMANAAVVHGFDVLKRETALDASMRGMELRFITVDVGDFVDVNVRGGKKGAKRTPSDVRVLSGMLLGLVGSSRRPWSLGWMVSVWRGGRRSVGAGALTYAFASRLPGSILDFLLLLPHRLAILKDSLQSQSQSHTLPQPESIPPPPATGGQVPLSESQRTASGTGTGMGSGTGNPTPSESEYTSQSSDVGDGDVGVGASVQGSARGGARTIADSWVSVKDDE